MKTLATIAVAVALALAAVPGMIAAEENENNPHAEVIAMIEDARGIDLSGWDYEVMEFQFELSPLAAGFEATFDWNNMDLNVKPLSTVPVSQNTADCLTQDVEWLSSTDFACGYQDHPGAIDLSTLICVTATDCFLDALDFWLFAYWFAVCNGPVVAVIDGHPGWSSGTCFVYYDSFGLPSQFTQWDSLVGTFGGVAYGKHN